MVESLDLTRISTKLCVSIGPDGRILSHKTLSPNWRIVPKAKIIEAVGSFKSSVKSPKVKDILNKKGSVTIWLSSNQQEILGLSGEDS